MNAEEHSESNDQAIDGPDLARLRRIIEAALLAAGEPVSISQLAGLFEEAERPSAGVIQQALEALQDDCSGRGVELREVSSGWRLQVRGEFMPWVSRLWEERPQRYSRALLETLALIAYRQPITRGEIESVRGVSLSSNIIRTLQEREWIRIVGHRDVPGKPALFGTTRAFLDYFNLRSLDELPTLAEIKDLDALEPELVFDGANDESAEAEPADESGPAAAVDAAAADTDDSAEVEEWDDDSEASDPEDDAIEPAQVDEATDESAEVDDTSSRKPE